MMLICISSATTIFDIYNFNLFVKKVHDAGLKCAVWTVDQPVVAKRWVEAGVDAVTSNCAAKAQKWVESH